jgi:hypothetical protein
MSALFLLIYWNKLFCVHHRTIGSETLDDQACFSYARMICLILKFLKTLFSNLGEQVGASRQG